jgi:NRPS condensation-like uncharacterized protein
MSTALEEHGRSGLAPDLAPGKPQRVARVPFTVLDEAIHLLDTPAEPWSIEIEVQVPGRLDDDRLGRAVRDAISRHPMTRVRLLPARHTDRRWQWEITAEPQLEPVMVMEAQTDAELNRIRGELQSISVPLVESPPLRFRLVHGPDGDSLMLNVNHAAFDGFGCLRFLQSVARAYTGATDPPSPVSLTEARNVVARLSAEEASEKRRRLQALAEQAHKAVQPPTRISPESGSDEPGYGILHRALSVEDTAALDSHELPGTVNDLLLAALHVAIERWNSDHRSRAGRITSFMPVNLRPPDWKEDAVTNFVLLSSVSTAADDRGDGQTAVAAIADQTQRVKEWGTGAAKS